MNKVRDRPVHSEKDIADALLSALQCGDPNCLILGDGLDEQATIDGYFDMRQVIRSLADAKIIRLDIQRR